MSHGMISSSACPSDQPGGQGVDFVLKEISLALVKLIFWCIQKYNRKNTETVEIKLKRWRFDAQNFFHLRRLLKCTHTNLDLLATFATFKNFHNCLTVEVINLNTAS